MSSSHGSVVEDINSTPSLLISLVQALSLLQNAVRARRITHFQPSTACVISCVRSVLSATDCLGRDSPALATFPTLAAARKQVLSDLARLVNQARKASEMRTLEEDEMDYEIEEMMRMGQTVYGHVRAFLDIAVHCGLELPERRALSPTEDPYDRLLGATPTPGGQDQDSDGYRADDRLSRPPVPLTNSALSSMSMRARSMVDLRNSARRTPTAPTFSHSPERVPHPPIPQEERPPSPAVSSYASGSSVSSFNSDSEAGHVSAWPRGPTSTAQLLVTLRATHDRLLSIIAAFIGHVHSHSQNAHASSKGHLIEMTRETVDQVRQLLALVDSVMATPEIAEAKPRELMALETAKSTLFAYTSSLVDSIRAITSLRATENEDEEKGTCLQAATGALRAGAECVTSVKLCLSRRMGEEPFTIFVLPPPSTYPAQDSRSNSPASSAAYSQYSSYGEELQRYAESADSDGDDQAPLLPEQTVADDTLHASGYEDPTMHVPQGPVSNVALAEMAVQRSRPSLDAPTARVPSRGPATPIADAFQRATTRISIRVDHAPLSETESQRTDEDSGSDRRDAPMLDSSPATSLSTLPSETFGALAGTKNGPTAHLEEKIKRGELPSVPGSASGIPPQAPVLSAARADPPAASDDWLVGDDYDPRDIALNIEGAMTGATLEVLVVKITDHRAFPDATFSHAFFLTFRLFTSPDDFLTLLMQRFALEPPQGRQLSPADLRAWEETKLRLVRVRTCNAMKSWLEGYWQPQTDGVVLPRMQQFLRDLATPALGSQAQRILDLVNIRIEQGATLSANGIGHKLTRARSADRLRPGLRDGLQISAAASANGAVPPTPVMHKTLHASLRNNSFNAVSVLDFDVLELGRQLTLMESRLYCAIRPEELLASGQAGVRAADSVRAVTTLSNSITGWVTECILNEQQDARKRTGLLKYFIKLADVSPSFDRFFFVSVLINTSPTALFKSS
jgi:son of sevenless